MAEDDGQPRAKRARLAQAPLFKLNLKLKGRKPGTGNATLSESRPGKGCSIPGPRLFTNGSSPSRVSEKHYDVGYIYRCVCSNPACSRGALRLNWSTQVPPSKFHKLPVTECGAAAIQVVYIVHDLRAGKTEPAFYVTTAKVVLGCARSFKEWRRGDPQTKHQVRLLHSGKLEPCVLSDTVTWATLGDDNDTVDVSLTPVHFGAAKTLQTLNQADLRLAVAQCAFVCEAEAAAGATAGASANAGAAPAPAPARVPRAASPPRVTQAQGMMAAYDAGACDSSEDISGLEEALLSYIVPEEFFEAARW